jgi:hypothetical protein
MPFVSCNTYNTSQAAQDAAIAALQAGGGSTPTSVASAVDAMTPAQLAAMCLKLNCQPTAAALTSALLGLSGAETSGNVLSIVGGAPVWQAPAAAPAIPTATDTVAGISALSLGTAAGDATNSTDALTAAGLAAILNGTAPNATPNALQAAALAAIPDTSATVKGLVNLVPMQVLGAGDKVINGVHIGRGSGDIGGNTRTGHTALYSNTTGNYNTASGYATLQNNTTGSFNTASGYGALQNNTTGSYNTASGIGTLYSNATGSYNTASGHAALQNNITGDQNTASGHAALYNNTTFINVSGLGYNSQVTGDNQVQLGDANTTVFVYGTVQNRSDLRDKTAVAPTSLGLDFVLRLKPIQWRWDMREDYREPMPEFESKIEGSPETASIKDKKEAAKAKVESAAKREQWLEKNKISNLKSDGSKARKRKHFGFGAQDVKKTIEELGVDFGGLQDHSVDGGEAVMSLGYDEFIAPVVKAIQEQHEIILALKTELARLSAKVK